MLTHMLLADDFFRLAHSDLTGRPLLHPIALSTGLAGALLGELMLEGFLDVNGGLIVLPAEEKKAGEERRQPQEKLSRAVLELLHCEDHPVGTWLEYLAQRSVRKVARRLEAAGHVTTERSRRRLREVVTYVPNHPLEASRPMSVLATRLNARYDVEPWYGVLAGFMVATGLHTRVLAGAPAESHQFMHALIARSSPPGMLELFGHVESVIGAAVLAHRT